jgi:hypothetical protein
MPVTGRVILTYKMEKTYFHAVMAAVQSILLYCCTSDMSLPPIQSQF